MKKRDSRTVTILIPATEKTPEVSANVSLVELEIALKQAIENKDEAIALRFKGKSINLSVQNVKSIVKTARTQFAHHIGVPKVLEKYLSNLSITISSMSKEKLSARDEEIEKLWTCLCSEQKSNAILVGEQGVGKTTMAYEVVRRINAKKAPKQLLNYTVLEVNTLKLLELADRSMFAYEYTLNNLLEFMNVNKSKVILYIDNLLHVKCDLGLMKCFLLFVKTNNVKIIASVSYDDFEKYFINDMALMKYMNPILLEEPEVEEIYPMLKTRIETLQKTYGVEISEKMIRFAILTGLYLSSSNSSNPESTLDIINFALADAKRKEQKEVTKLNVLSYYYIDFKLAKRTNETDKWITAYHEVGHYLVSQMSDNIRNFKNAFVSILPIEGALGLTATYWDSGKQLTCSKDYYIDEIAFSLGGRVGEAIYTSKFSSGAQQDLISANAMAEKLVLAYGLADIDGEHNKNYMIGNYVKDFLLTDELREKINKEISNIIDTAYKRAETIINENMELLKEIVDRLVEEGVLMGDELEEICEKYKKI